MHVHVLQFEENEFIGSMQDWFKEKAYPVATTQVYKNHSLPNVNDFDWLVVMGGGMSVNDTDKYDWIAATKDLIIEAIEAGKRVLGVCLGGQLIASALGAKIYPNAHQEIGWFPMLKSDEMASWLPDNAKLLCWHGDCFELPKGAKSFASSEITPCQGFYLSDKVWALQFHLEAEEDTAEIFKCASGGSVGEGPYIQAFDEIKNANPEILQSKKIMRDLLEKIDTA